MRPETLDDYAGQQHILGQGMLLRRAIEADRFSSLILYGPPGVGKTTLARIIAGHTASQFENLSGVESSVADIRKKVELARHRLQVERRTTILFVEASQRCTKAQQDVLLPHIERGTVRFIGATTHNPYFYINSPLVSRSQVFQLEPLINEDLVSLLHRAARVGFEKRVSIDDDAARHLAKIADGDARKCLNALEIGVLTTEAHPEVGIRITLAIAEESIQQKTVVYDGDGDAHYDTISAFIKSMRGSDPDATLYWLAKMLYAGEDPRFIARRIVIAASEDVGLADSNALQVAIAAQQAVEFVGMPEGQIPLAHAAVYIATAPKSNRSYAGLFRALKDIKEGRTLAVPKHLRDTHYSGSRNLGHGEGYRYAHDSEDGYVPQSYLPEGKLYYEPTENGQEKRIKERMNYWKAKYLEAQRKPKNSTQD
ncbi:MAG: replication-associated recombination protein A [Verrucomicrobiota bacterium]